MDSLAIIIVNYKNYEITSNCVNQLLDLNLRADIVIVDNGSNNGSFEILVSEFSNQGKVYILESKVNLGYSGGNNFGIKYINKVKKPEYICIMNPDVVIKDNELFKDLVLKLKNNDDIASISARQVYCGVPQPNWKYSYNPHTPWLLAPSFFKKYLEKIFRNESLSYYKGDFKLCITRIIPGSFFIINNKVFNQIGYFDENIFLYYEEELLAIKLKKIGKIQVVDVSRDYYHNHEFRNKEMRNSYSNYYMTNKFFVDSARYIMKIDDNQGIIKYLFRSLTNAMFLNFEVPLKYGLIKTSRFFRRIHEKNIAD